MTSRFPSAICRIHVSTRANILFLGYLIGNPRRLRPLGKLAQVHIHDLTTLELLVVEVADYQIRPSYLWFFRSAQLALTKTPLRLSTSLKTFVRMLDSAKISQDVQEIRTTQPNRTRFSNRRSIPRFYLSMLSEK